MNYEILGNTDAYLHAHLFPRDSWEPPERLGLRTWVSARSKSRTTT